MVLKYMKLIDYHQVTFLIVKLRCLSSTNILNHPQKYDKYREDTHHSMRDHKPKKDSSMRENKHHAPEDTEKIPPPPLDKENLGYLNDENDDVTKL